MALCGFRGLLVAVPLFATFFVIVKMIYVEDTLERNVDVKGEAEAVKNVEKLGSEASPSE
jgi:hypothetical protein